MTSSDVEGRKWKGSDRASKHRSIERPQMSRSFAERSLLSKSCVAISPGHIYQTITASSTITSFVELKLSQRCASD